MEGLPVLTQSGDEKYPDMVKVLSAARHWAPEQRDRETDLFHADITIYLQYDRDKPAGRISVSENIFSKHRNNCKM